ncbi:hypothetical protein [Ulvibacter litoralis]|uniref:Signal transducing protein n=1 Tax=Ulvibacter litoralis TaxID=227084 RepID=A0A1G7ICK7_9FLAO|nr:hypothetical protein [Ulvibacter litoralis]GHC61863.1 hypothetical protein GCM10008083_28620 [Ulvibacter litoralis]SDF10079.1 hypothetical protein SAMN05421855_105193 [Ulvibacter litoralis]
MIEVFITNVKSEYLSKEILKFLKSEYPQLKINFDLEDFNKPYPCGHSILRIEGELIDTTSIEQQLKNIGIECKILEEKKCI